jgi:ABC-type bacteriocin/lantibiotic exporter with double-glycine peptidase domain
MSETRQHLTDAELVLLHHVGFVVLVPEHLRELVCRMFRRDRFGFGDEIVRQGDEPDSLFVLTSGSARVVVRRNDADVMLNRLVPGAVFGETALMVGAPRTATVRASGDVEVLRLPRQAFDALVDLHPEIADALSAHIRMQEIRDVLQLHPAFSVLPLRVLSQFLDAFETMEVVAGEVIVRENGPADAIYAVTAGRLTVSQGENAEVIGYLRVGDFFGERGLFENTGRRATVTAAVVSKLLRVDAGAVGQLRVASPRFAARLGDLAEARDRRGADLVPLDFVEDEIGEAATDPPEVDVEPGPPTSTLQVRGRRRFPFVAQFDATDCGVACLAMVTRHFGRDVSVTFLRDVAETGTEGTTLTGIVEAGRAVGLDVEARRVSRDRLDELTLPAIVHWRGDHWVVLYDLGKDRARIADPAVGLRIVPRSEFDHDWTGFAASVRPTAALDEAPVDDASLRWLMPFLTEHRGTLAVAFILALLVAGCEVAVPVTVQHMVAALTSRTGVSRINLFGLLLLGIVGASGLCLYLQRRILVGVAVSFDTSTLDFLTARLLDLPMSYFARRRTGDLERRIAGMADVRRLIVQEGIQAATAVLLLVVAIILMITYSVPLALAFIATIPLYAGMMRYSRRRLRPVFAGMEEAHGYYQSRQIDLLKGVETVKTLGAETGLRSKLRDTFSDVTRRVTPAYQALGRYEAMVAALSLATYATFVYLGALAVHAHSISLSQYVAFMALVLTATAPLLALMYFWDQVQMSSVLLARIHDVLAHEPEQGDRRDGLRPVTSLQGHIVVNDVEFRYRAHDQAILSGINLDVPPGTTVALVGRSGSGKSTLLRLLAGLLDPTSGSISYDGVDIADVRHRELRARIGFVLQTPYVFDATVAENIAFGSHPVDDDALRRTAQIADVDGFVSRLPLGYDTRIGDGGLKLSGGQAQRIAIARALYRSPPVVFFDEATSALDAESEQTIKQNLDQLARGRTAFIVTHRLTSIRDVDLIVVLDGGRVVETGTHDALLNSAGLYAHLYRQQFLDRSGA